MHALRKLKVGPRLALGFGLLLLLIVATLAVLLYGNRLKAAQFQHVVDVNMVKMRMLNRLMETTDGNLSEVSTLLQAIARGDLTARMEGDFHGVFGRMRDDANATVAQLTSIVGRIQNSASSINLAASEIATGNSDLSRRTEQQAANLEETPASMEEPTSTVRQNAEHARQANQLADAVSVFRTGDSAVPAHGRTAKPAIVRAAAPRPAPVARAVEPALVADAGEWQEL